jgi:hypothetical protein
MILSGFGVFEASSLIGFKKAFVFVMPILEFVPPELLL